MLIGISGHKLSGKTTAAVAIKENKSKDEAGQIVERILESKDNG